MTIDKSGTDPHRTDGDDANAITPLEGEAGIPSVTQARASNLSWKGIVAATLLLLSLVAVGTLTIHRALSSDKAPGDAESKIAANRPAAAATEPRKLDMTPAPRPVAASVPVGPPIPVVSPAAEAALAEPIGVWRTGATTGAAAGPQRVAPEDAPAVLVSSRPGPDTTARATAPPLPPGAEHSADDPLDGTKRNLEAYQRQLQGLLATLTKSTELAAPGPALAPLSGPSGLSSPAHGALPGPLHSTIQSAGGAGLFGGQLQGSATTRVAAAQLGNRSLTLPKGTAFTCALKTKVVSAASGFIGCQVLRNVFSDDGRVLLIERGSHMDGEYRATSVRPGTVRIPVLWTRIRTPLGVTVEIDSPGTGPLGESGIDGFVDNRWVERIGAAMLVSLINDSVQLIIQNQANDSGSETVIFPSTTSSTSKLAEKVLESTINIPPLIYQNQGGVVGIYVARDVDFSSVYELQALPR
jgi:type IV secretion system protein VirB10